MPPRPSLVPCLARTSSVKSTPLLNTRVPEMKTTSSWPSARTASMATEVGTSFSGLWRRPGRLKLSVRLVVPTAARRSPHGVRMPQGRPKKDSPDAVGSSKPNLSRKRIGFQCMWRLPAGIVRSQLREKSQVVDVLGAGLVSGEQKLLVGASQARYRVTGEAAVVKASAG